MECIANSISIFDEFFSMHEFWRNTNKKMLNYETSQFPNIGHSVDISNICTATYLLTHQTVFKSLNQISSVKIHKILDFNYSRWTPYTCLVNNNKHNHYHAIKLLDFTNLFWFWFSFFVVNTSRESVSWMTWPKLDT